MQYWFEEEIGRGGFGIVYRARGEDDALYAIKTLNLAAFGEAEREMVEKRFEREVRYQEQILHPNVVPVLERHLDATPPWFVMPLAIGNLADEIAADKTLGGDPRKQLFDILAGLEALHDKGFCHRDLKPANVLKFQNADGSITYKISDFGLTTPGAGQTTTLTGTNMGGGTVMYRPPECANNFRRATAQADIYSFGAILHDIFGATGRIPHSKLTVPGPLGPIVEKCTEPNSHRRYRAVANLREDLFNVLSNEEVEFYSREEEEIIDLMNSGDDLNDDQWDRIFNLIDDNADKGLSNNNLMRALSIEHIRALSVSTPDMFHALGTIYAEYAQNGTFGFEYCDIISDKAQIFFDVGDFQLKAQIAVAMLELGTGHNRWRVEHQFMRMAGPEVEEALANRIRIELDVQGVPFVRRIEHIELSISQSRENLHPVLRAYLAELNQ